jgi:hypothetical protein
VTWGYWLFIVFVALAVVRLVRGRMRLRDAQRSPHPTEWLSIYGPLILVAGLFVAYVLAGAVTRGFIIALLVVATLGPFVVAFLDGTAGGRQAHQARVVLFLLVAAFAALIVLSFLIKLLLVLLAMAAIVVVLVFAAVLLGLIGRRGSR